MFSWVDCFFEELEEPVEGHGDDDGALLAAVGVAGFAGHSSPGDCGVGCAGFGEGFFEGLVDVELLAVFDFEDPFVVGGDADVALVIGAGFGESFGVESVLLGLVDDCGFLAGAEGAGWGFHGAMSSGVRSL